MNIVVLLRNKLDLYPLIMIKNILGMISFR